MATLAPPFASRPKSSSWPLLQQHQLSAVQHVRRMRGGSQAQMMRGSDNRCYVVKMLPSPQHNRVLANDFFASRLGQLLELPMSDVAVMEVSEWLIRNSPELRIESGGQSQPFASGLHFASQVVADPHYSQVFDYLPESLFPAVVNRFDISKALVLDKWTSNSDGRQLVFTKLLASAGYAVYLVDQGYSFNAGEWTFPDFPLHGVYYRNYVYAHVTSWEDFEPALSIAEGMDMDEIWSCAADIPREWCGNKPSELARLVEALHKRRSKIRDLISAFRDSQRKPFPNWIGN